MVDAALRVTSSSLNLDGRTGLAAQEMIEALTGLHQVETSLDDALDVPRPGRCGIGLGDLALSFVKDGGEVQFVGVPIGQRFTFLHSSPLPAFLC